MRTSCCCSIARSRTAIGRARTKSSSPNSARAWWASSPLCCTATGCDSRRELRMGYDTRIPYVDSSWNFLRGCTRRSTGCKNCYAERVSARFSGPGEPYEGVAEWRDGRPRWTGELRVIEKHLDGPLYWKKPRRTFVNSMSDTFHELAPNEVIGRAFEVMRQCPQHTFLLFTKRPDRMKAYVEVCQGGKLPPNVWVGTTVEDPEH